MLRRGCSRPGRARGTADNYIMALSKVCRVGRCRFSFLSTSTACPTKDFVKEFNVRFVEMHKDVDRECRSREYARATSCDHPQSHSLKTSFLGRLVTFSCLPSVKARRENKAIGLHFKVLLSTMDQGPGKANDRRRRAAKARQLKTLQAQSNTIAAPTSHPKSLYLQSTDACTASFFLSILCQNS